MNIFIYRPDKHLNKNIDLNDVYTLKGKRFFDWQQEQQNLKAEIEQEKKEQKEGKPDWKVYG